MTTTPAALEQARGGHRGAFDSLVAPLLEPAYRLAYGMLLDRGAAEDAVQEAALNAWRSLDRFRGDGELKPWFFAIVANQCRSVRRGRWWSVLKGVDIQVERPDSAAGLAANLDLRRAMLALKPRDRALLILHYSHGLTLEQTAVALGISLGAAKSRLHRTLRRLHEQVEVVETWT
jgi:RNA polymerase sigma-70 factor, ECF subfamily